MYDWNGQSFDDETWQQGRRAGISGALAELARNPVHGSDFAGFFTRLAAGFGEGQDNFLVRAIQLERQRDADALAEESRRQQIEESQSRIDERDRVTRAIADFQAANPDVGLSGIPSIDDNIISQHFANKVAAQQLQDAQSFARSNDLPVPTGNKLLDELQQKKWEFEHPKPASPMTAYQQWRVGQEEADDLAAEDEAFHVGITDALAKARAGQAAAAEQAALRQMLGPLYTGIRDIDVPTAKGIQSGDIDRPEPAPLPKPNLPPPAPKPKAGPPPPEVVKQMETTIVPPNVSAATPKNGPTPEPHTTPSPYFPTNEAVDAAISTLPVPPAMKQDKNFSKAFRDEVAAVTKALIDSGMSEKQARQQAMLAISQKVAAQSAARGFAIFQPQ